MASEHKLGYNSGTICYLLHCLDRPKFIKIWHTQQTRQGMRARATTMAMTINFESYSHTDTDGGGSAVICWLLSGMSPRLLRLISFSTRQLTLVGMWWCRLLIRTCNEQWQGFSVILHLMMLTVPLFCTGPGKHPSAGNFILPDLGLEFETSHGAAIFFNTAKLAHYTEAPVPVEGGPDLIGISMYQTDWVRGSRVSLDVITVDGHSVISVHMSLVLKFKGDSVLQRHSE